MPERVFVLSECTSRDRISWPAARVRSRIPCEHARCREQASTPLGSLFATIGLFHCTGQCLSEGLIRLLFFHPSSRIHRHPLSLQNPAPHTVDYISSPIPPLCKMPDRRKSKSKNCSPFLSQRGGKAGGGRRVPFLWLARSGAKTQSSRGRRLERRGPLGKLPALVPAAGPSIDQQRARGVGSGGVCSASLAQLARGLGAGRRERQPRS